MTSRDTMFEPMLIACPSFRPAWAKFLPEWQHDRTEARVRPLYLALNALARHLGQHLQIGNADAFNAVFRVVERWHVEGDAYVRNAATVGFLEDLQNPANIGDKSPAEFVLWLGPETMKGWRALERFWGHPETPHDAQLLRKTSKRTRS
jgi:hypothetical protein